MDINYIENRRFTRIPKPGETCKITGLSRSSVINILATGRVRTHSIQLPGKSRGSRLIDVQSLMDFIRQCPASPVTRGGGVSTVNSLPHFLQDMLKNPPQAGDGINGWLFSVARQLHQHFDEATIVKMLEDCTQDCGRSVPHREILRATQNSHKCAWRPKHSPSASISSKVPAKTDPAPSWPQPNPILQKEILDEFGPLGGLAELLELSNPRPLDDLENETEFIFDMLFPNNPLICIGTPMGNGKHKRMKSETQRREDWRGKLSKQSLIVPSPMTKKNGQTQEGKSSQRTLENVGDREYLIVEFDKHSISDQCAFHLFLGELCPLVCVTHSGNKSLHGWYLAKGVSDKHARNFFELAVKLGADRATWNKIQLVRIPGGTRQGVSDKPNKRQMVYYLNFEPLKTVK